MLGYLRPFKPELKVKEFEAYKGLYCGLCKELGREYGPISRFALSYDFTFLVLLFCSLDNQSVEFEKKGCVFNPFVKKSISCRNYGISFAASSTIIMLYYKLLDDIHDKGLTKKIKAIVAYPYISLCRKKAAKKNPNADIIFSDLINTQLETEKKDEVSLDEAAEPTANALANLFKLVGNQENSQILYRFGYALGRWIYFMDAIEDLRDDIAKNNFNPLKKMLVECNNNFSELINRILPNLQFCKTEAVNQFLMIDTNLYGLIMENLLVLGLDNNMNNVISKAVSEWEKGRIKE